MTEVIEFPGHPLADWQEEVTAGRTVQSYRDWAREREAGLTDEEADAKVTCRNCSQTLDGNEDEVCPEPGSNTGEGDDEDDDAHVPDVELSEPPADYDQTRLIRLDLIVRVPNDGYEYMSDIQGRIERFMGRLLEDRLISSVRTGGPSGSGYVTDVVDDLPKARA